MQRTRTTSIVLVALMIVLSACGANTSRNADGSLKLETELQEATVLDMLSIAFSDTSIKIDSLDLHPGHVHVYGECADYGGGLRPMELSLQFDIDDGVLVTEITEADFDGITVDDTTLAQWNTAIANRLVDNRVGTTSRHLEEVEVTPTTVCLTWRLETAQSLGD